VDERARKRCLSLAAGFLGDSHVCGLRLLRPLNNFEFNPVALLQRSVSFARNRAVMDENVRSILPPDESKPLRFVEPLDLSLHLSSPHLVL
jgi:hypothetical protein